MVNGSEVFCDFEKPGDPGAVYDGYLGKIDEKTGITFFYSCQQLVVEQAAGFVTEIPAGANDEELAMLQTVEFVECHEKTIYLDDRFSQFFDKHYGLF